MAHPSHRRSRPGRLRGAVGLALAAVLLTSGVVGGLTAGGRVGNETSQPASAVADTVSPSPLPAAASWPDALPIPPDADDAERLAIKLSYSFVALSRAQAAAVLAEPSLGALVLPAWGDDAALMVPNAALTRVREIAPDAEATPNAVVEATADQSPTPSWGLDAVDAPDATQDAHYFYDTTGAGVTAYVVDTGVQADHPDFGGRVDAASGHDETGDGRGTADCNGHGTHVAGTIGSTTYGVAKGVRLVPVRVLGCDGKGSLADLYYALAWIVNDHTGSRSVINMSTGAPSSPYITSAVRSAVNKGFTVVAAAGNDAVDACTSSPASAPEAITVGATDSSSALAWYSNRGSCVDILAPGSDIISTYIGSAVASASGTSMASPHVAGLAARLLEAHPSWRAADVLAGLTSDRARGKIANVPSGTANLFAAIPAVPRVSAVTATASSSGIDISWTRNDVGAAVTFAVTVTDTTTGRVYPVVVSGSRSSTVFTATRTGHAYSVTVGGTAGMPSGARVAFAEASALVAVP